MKNTVKCGYKNCPCEDKQIIVNSQTIYEVVRYDNKYYHSDCFIKMIHEKRKKCNNESLISKYNYALENIDTYKKDAYTCLIDRVKKNELNEFLINNYNIDSIPSYTWIKLNGIFSGKYKSVRNDGIPPEHLLDMWKRHTRKLKQNCQKMIVKGKSLTPNQQLLYDLEILISKYDGYLKWLCSQEVIESDMKIVSESNDEFLTRNIKTQENNTVKDEIEDIVDDIFG